MASLAEDARLLRSFLREVACWEPKPGRHLWVEEQSLAGEANDEPTPEKQRGSLPDGWIHDGDRWSVLIESKVGTKLTRDQLDRQLFEAKRRGFDHVRILAIVVVKPGFTLPREVKLFEWSEIYQWLQSKLGSSRWATIASEYLEVAEAKMIDEEATLNGSLTQFTGIPFGPDRAYNYGEAKRVLRLLMTELRKEKRLANEIGIDPKLPGRPAITGKRKDGIWDLLQFKEAEQAEKFTHYPHLNLSINRAYVKPQLVLPNSMRPALRRRLCDLGRDGFVSFLAKVEKNTRPILKKYSGASPTGRAVHRHYRGQRVSVIDARLDFDLRTISATQRKNSSSNVKVCDAWVDSTWEALQTKKINFEMGIGIHLPYSDAYPLRDARTALDFAVDSWVSAKPLLDVIFDR
jgi:hypothetical protein